MLIANKRIAIIGGGPGGLTLARLLQMNGADVIVYERDRNRHGRVQGATLDLHHDSGLKALRAAGLMEQFAAAYRPGAERIRIAGKDGSVVHDEHDQPQDMDLDHEHARPEIDRGPLRDILLDSLMPGTVMWDCQFSSLEAGGSGWKLHFKNRPTADADIVIAADGANSRVRSYITNVLPFYAGVTVVEGAVYDAATRIPALDSMVNGGKVFALGDEQSLILSAKGDGTLAFYTGSKMPENHMEQNGIDITDNEQAAAWFRKAFSGWSVQWDELFKHADKLMLRPQYCMPPDQQWTTQANITMLGDAAHLMPPYAGEGVNMAMQDALELSEALLSTQHASVHAAIAAFEEQMRSRASAVATMTLEQTALLHAPGALDYLAGVMSGENHQL